jgi:hypothetical protein
MASLSDGGFVVEDQTDFSFGPDVVLLTGQIVCLSGITVDVLKIIGVRSGKGANAVVQTDLFRYQAWVRGENGIFRYCSAHNHRPYAHKHVYDTFDRTIEPACLELRTEDEVPTLLEVIEELQGWHYANASRLAALN